MFDIQTYDTGLMSIDWEPAKYKTKAGAAKALYKALCKKCKEVGMDPKSEVWIMNPDEAKAHGYAGYAWHVCWESSPWYDWGCAAFATGKWGHCETYWGFDLGFYDQGDHHVQPLR